MTVAVVVVGYRVRERAELSRGSLTTVWRTLQLSKKIGSGVNRSRVRSPRSFAGRGQICVAKCDACFGRVTLHTPRSTLPRQSSHARPSLTKLLNTTPTPWARYRSINMRTTE